MLSEAPPKLALAHLPTPLWHSAALDRLAGAEVWVKRDDMTAGAEAGNMALRTMATGGVYVGGGIAPKILPKLREDAFLEAFRNKGRMRELVSRIPLRVVLEARAGLLGAALEASLASAQP